MTDTTEDILNAIAHLRATHNGDAEALKTLPTPYTWITNTLQAAINAIQDIRPHLTTDQILTALAEATIQDANQHKTSGEKHGGRS